MTPTHSRSVPAVLLSAALLLGCSAGTDGPAGQDAASEQAATTTLPAEPAVVLPDSDPARAALATSQALFTAAPAVVLAPGDDPHGVEHAAELGAPLLVVDGDAEALLAELDRLGTDVVLATEAARQQGAALAAVEDAGVEVVTDPGDLPATGPAATEGLVALTDGSAWAAAAAATAGAAGGRVITVEDADPRADPDVVEQLARADATHVLALGEAFGPPERLAARVATAATGTQLPGGGQVVFPHRRMVALYGHPGSASLGVLGEQDVEDAVTRAREVAAEYEPHSDLPVVPAFEIIATVASDDPGPDGDFSREAPVDRLRPWVDAAREAGVYVLLDLQPGTTDFLTQARRYEDLLAEPHVGLALDPEWRLRDGQRHMEQIGSVDAAEVNAVTQWLAGLTAERSLPQKVLVLHQFRTSMIVDRHDLDTGRDEVAVMIHADGNGAPADKLGTWEALRAGAPEGLHWAWKNFYDEDAPTFTPEQTMDVEPAPLLITYQ